MRPYLPGDFDRFEPRADFAAAQEAMGRPLEGHTSPPGPTWTILRGSGDREAVLGCGGAVERDGVWQAWACLAELPRADWPQLLWLAERALGHLERIRPQRIRADALAADPAAILCLRKLGFATASTWIDPRLPGQVFQAMFRGR